MGKNRSSDNWQLSKARPKERLEYLLSKKQWSDCAFAVGTKIFNAHKLLLAMSSPVFEAMFYGELAEMEYPIPIVDVEPEAFQAVLDYIYTDNSNIATLDLACAVWYAAKKYMLPVLVAKCKKIIFKVLSTGNACQAYEFSKLHDEPELTKRSLQIMMDNTEAVVADSRFEEVELGTLLLVLDTPCAKSEVVLFDAVLRWARKECGRKGLPEDSGNLRHVVGPALEKIHFLSFTPYEFTEGPAQAPLLTKDEMLSILMRLSNPSLPIPPGFATEIYRCPRCTQGGIPKEDFRGEKSLQIVKFNVDRIIRAKFNVDRSIRAKFNVDRTTSVKGRNVSTFQFSVDTDITIFGIQVRMDYGHAYNEILNASIGLMGHHFILEKEVSSHNNSELEIDFDNLIELRKNEICTIAVETLGLGAYFDCRPNKEENWNCDGVTFFGSLRQSHGIVNGIKFCRSIKTG